MARLAYSLCPILLILTTSPGIAAPPQSGPASRPASAPAGGFEPVGLGGGGAMFAPASSPHDPDLMFVSCDMGGFYRSADGGHSWTMLDFRMIRGSTTCRPVFHPKDRHIIYFDGKVSRDAGLTWQRLVQRDVGQIRQMAVDPDTGRLLLIGTDQDAWISHDGGRAWARCGRVHGSVVGLYIEPADGPGPGRMFVATALGVFRSTDGGKTFEEVRQGLPWLQIRSFAGGALRRAGGQTQGKTGGGRPLQGTAPSGAEAPAETVLYCTIPSRKGQDGRFDGGIYRSVDGGTTWTPAMGAGLDTRIVAGEKGAPVLAQYSQLGVAPVAGMTVYVVCKGSGAQPPAHGTIYRSDDAGTTWRAVYYPDPRTPLCNVEHGWLGLTFGESWGGLASPDGFTVNPARPDIAMLANSGELFITSDGGKGWRQAYTRHAPGQDQPAYRKNVGRWQSIGLEVTSTWGYDIDPFNPDRHYICYTDIGFAISEDAGRTWHNNSRSSGTPWTNTTYMLAFDPAVAGRVWAAMSNVHDIPHWSHIQSKVKGPGGVCLSTDHGRTWKPAARGLPDAPCTSIALDPESPADARTLYVTMFDQGVYRSTDGGATWARRSDGLPEDNRHVFLVKRHRDGTLFACVTGLRQDLKFPVLGGLYRSKDGGESWQNITASQPLHWPTGFDFDPRDSRVIYLAAATIPSGREGGLYRTGDGGATWRRLLRDEDFTGHGGSNYVQAMFVTVDPRRPDSMYLGTVAHGLWHSPDAGRTWRQTEGIPARAVQRVAFDPRDARRLYVTTFGGGVWRH